MIKQRSIVVAGKSPVGSTVTEEDKKWLKFISKWYAVGLKRKDIEHVYYTLTSAGKVLDLKATNYTAGFDLPYAPLRKGKNLSDAEFEQFVQWLNKNGAEQVKAKKYKSHPPLYD